MTAGKAVKDTTRMEAGQRARREREARGIPTQAAELTRLRAQVAAADKLAERCLIREFRYGVVTSVCCHCCGVFTDRAEDLLHTDTCDLAAYLASRAPESPFPTASGFPDP